jgi:hypothetical protein
MIVRTESKLGFVVILSVWSLIVCVGKLIFETENNLVLVVVLIVSVFSVFVTEND